MSMQHIGAQVAYWRKRRGKSQRVLADLAGISQPYLSQIETGNKSLDRRSTLVALADALQVSVGELTGQPGDPTDPARARIAAHIPAIREALIMRDIGETRSATPETSAALAGLAELSDSIEDAIAPALPALITTANGPDLVMACYATMTTCKSLGYLDLARDAARVGLAAARELDDPVWIGAAETIRLFSMPTEFPGTGQLATRAVEQIQPHLGDSRARQACGMLHLCAALRAAVAGQAGDAADHLREAQAVAGSLGDPADRKGLAGFAFGPTNVGIWRLAIQAEMGDTEKAIADASQVRPERVAVPNRQAMFYLDLARACARSGRHDDRAVSAFLRAESIAPNFVRLRPVVRDTIQVILRRTQRRAVSSQLRHAASMVGLRIDR